MQMYGANFISITKSLIHSLGYKFGGKGLQTVGQYLKSLFILLGQSRPQGSGLPRIAC